MTLRRTGGIDYLTKFILNASNTFNGFDQFGHFLLAQLQITNCVEYDVTPVTGCDARWFDDSAGNQSAALPKKAPQADPVDPSLGLDMPDTPEAPTLGSAPQDQADSGDGAAAAAEAAKGTKDLLNFLIGSGG